MAAGADRSAVLSEPPHEEVPDFFIVGHAKSGTTALYEMLRRHPQVFMPALKESQFFAQELHPRAVPSSRHPRSLGEYLALFETAAPHQRRGEASPSYIRSLTAAQRIAELQPDARIVAILREPVSFLRSLHLELLQNHIETEADLGRAIALSESRRAAREGADALVQQALIYADHVRYVEQLRRWHAAFPPEQVLVLIYDDFRADNEGAVRRVLRFLDVDEDVPLQTMEANPTVRVRSPRAHEMVRSLYMGQGRLGRSAKAAIKALVPRRLRRRAHSTVRRRLLFAAPREPDERLAAELRRRFAPEVAALSEYLDRDLVTLWGYGAGG